MKKRTKNIILSVISALFVGVAMGACGESRTPSGNLSSSSSSSSVEAVTLSSPQDLYLSIEVNDKTEYVLRWNEVENASGYEIKVGEETFFAEENEWNATEHAALNALFEASVCATGDGVFYENSESVSYQGVAEEVKYRLEYRELINGSLEVSQGSVKPKGRLVIPDVYDGKRVSRIKENGFRGSDSLPSESFGGLAPADGITSIRFPKHLQIIGDDAFFGCTSLTEVEFPDTVSILGMSVLGGCTRLTRVVFPKTIKYIPELCCDQCYSLKQVEIPESVEKIGYGAFFSSGLTSVKIPINVEIVADDAFSYTALKELFVPIAVKEFGCLTCENLESLVFEKNIRLEKLGALVDNQNLKKIVIPKNVKEIYSDIGLFSGCSSLTEIGVEAGNTVYQSIDGHLYTADGTKFLQYASGKTDAFFQVPSSVREIEPYSFARELDLKKVVLPEGVTKIGKNAFEGCSALEEVDLPETLEEIGIDAFKSSGLKVIPKLPSSMKTIGKSVFSWCKFTNVRVPEGVETVGADAFLSCTLEQKYVILPQSLRKIESGAFLQRSFSTVLIMERVYYAGTKTSWDLIEGTENTSPATVYYYSENEPTGEGSYWRYDENGNPEIWE